MTDNDIIKALEHTKLMRIAHDGRIVSGEVIDEAINLIKLQKAEIENLNIELQAMQNAANGYKKEVKRLEIVADGFIELEKLYRTAKAEAVKEFADRLKEKYNVFNDYKGAQIKSDVDNLVKKMVGD